LKNHPHQTKARFMSPDSPSLVSIHGGHSGQFCNHASDTLEEIVLEYIRQGFAWIGITEHAPAAAEDLLYPDERDSGLTPESLMARFRDYIAECRRLQQKYAAVIRIFVGIEIETYKGYRQFVPALVRRFKPDYLVGSVHFVNDTGFDYSAEYYGKAVDRAGGIEKLYHDYFDTQFDMIAFLEPAVVGHFDLIRLYDDNYPKTLRLRSIQEKIKRNLTLIKERDLLLDFNLRAMLKGAPEPYISRPILEMVREMDIPVVPGDDSHGVSSVGCCMEEGVRILKELGFSTHWREPGIFSY
jgi:histidinol-phosphatase (PHP family)